MNSDVLALYLSIAIALTKTIENLLNGTLSGFNLSVTLILSLAFWLNARHVCDVLTWKKYIRGWAQGNRGIIYVSRKEQPFLYVVFFLTFVAMSTFLGFLVMISSKLST